MEHGGQEARRPHGELVADVMAVLWAAEQPMTPRQVNRALGLGLARTTVATILIRLHEKGTLVRTRSGRGYAYAPADDAAGLAAGRMRDALDAEPDRDLVLKRFVSSLSEHDEGVLRALLRQADGSGDGR
ncbi:putative transcriptional regulator [Kitasatospora sp. SolWspMP-SS2h]|uniref:BlaI/MecI/CopY family transcriptional regulator n=1 Tax=Kitasatospora sp. SolWspMP-SS2h TaxID=1305729 RepID=UPI000DB9CAEA|nr:BlaI/MecI/CopY family transcriptional regulator [Kitasatospora sp. SolWspMP-SS2h]RAJ36795.1 putative transcriptional regulator [Kitasatospora sp. SolWspMP-SS2h]